MSLVDYILFALAFLVGYYLLARWIETGKVF